MNEIQSEISGALGIDIEKFWAIPEVKQFLLSIRKAVHDSNDNNWSTEMFDNYLERLVADFYHYRLTPMLKFFRNDVTWRFGLE